MSAQYPATPSSYVPPDSAFSLMSRKTTAIDGKTLEGENDSIRVVVRVRPLNNLEKQRNDGQIVNCSEDLQTLKIDGNLNGKPIPPMTFHRVFGEQTNQDEMFANCGVTSMIESAVEGYNTTIFAYGQTGSGKTFTITGPEETSFSNAEDSTPWGIVPRSLRYLFDLLNQKQAIDETKFTVHACFLEIYNEQVQDLLNPSSISLPVRYGTEKGFYVENLFVVECEVLDDCLAVLEEGLRNRKIASHRLNEHSSRSHSMMTIYVESENIDPDDQRVIRKKGKICFVDLAGSERVKESKATGDTLTETLNINKSLLTLGNCISALSDMKRKKSGTTHVPYRDSKLTKLLSETLGGNGMTMMVACISPSGFNMNETINTLRYASRAKRIQNRPMIQMDPREELIMNLKKELKTTKAENESLRQMIMELSNGANSAQLPLQTPISPKNSSNVGKTTANVVRLPLISSPSAAIGLQQIPNVTSEPKETPELLHTKQMLTRFMDENTHLKSENAELTTNSHKITRENRELMEENDRLIGKIEKLVEIFGNSLDEGLKAPVEQPGAGNNPLNVNLGNTRLYLLSRRTHRRKEDEPEKESQKKTIHIGLDFSKNRAIDRSLSDIHYVASSSSVSDSTANQAPKLSAVENNVNTTDVVAVPNRKNSQITEPPSLDQIQRNKAQLKRELRELDNEINKMKV